MMCSIAADKEDEDDTSSAFHCLFAQGSSVLKNVSLDSLMSWRLNIPSMDGGLISNTTKFLGETGSYCASAIVVLQQCSQVHIQEWGSELGSMLEVWRRSLFWANLGNCSMLALNIANSFRKGSIVLWM